MNYDSYLQNCGDDDVISFSQELVKFSRFKQALESTFNGKIPDALIESLESHQIKGIRIKEYFYDGRGRSSQQVNRKWFAEGKNCEILKLGAKGWQKGKLRVKVTLEFCPDEPEVEETPAINNSEIEPPESPLDDLRQLINQNNP